MSLKQLNTEKQKNVTKRQLLIFGTHAVLCAQAFQKKKQNLDVLVSQPGLLFKLALLPLDFFNFFDTFKLREHVDYLAHTFFFPPPTPHTKKFIIIEEKKKKTQKKKKKTSSNEAKPKPHNIIIIYNV